MSLEVMVMARFSTSTEAMLTMLLTHPSPGVMKTGPRGGGGRRGTEAAAGAADRPRGPVRAAAQHEGDRPVPVLREQEFLDGAAGAFDRHKRPPFGSVVLVGTARRDVEIRGCGSGRAGI